MTKLLKKILILALAIICALSLVACSEDGKSDSDKGLLCKKIGGVYTIYKYVGNSETTELDIAKALKDLGLEDQTDIRIQSEAFNGDNTLTKIIVPESVTKIEKGAFAGMKKLQTLSIPFVGMTSRSDVFVGQTSGELNEDDQTLKIEKSVDSERTIAHLFGESEYDEGVLQTINFGTGSSSSSDGSTTTQSATCYMPLTLTEIVVTGNYNIPMCAFNGLTKWIKISVTGAVKEIGEYAFANATQMTEITLPTSVEKIHNGAFSGASKLATVNFADLTALKVIGDSAFENTALTKITTPDSLTNIGTKAFAGCTALTEISLNNKLAISQYAFRNCTKLTTINTDRVTTDLVSLDDFVFDGCEELKATGYTLASFTQNANSNAFPA